MRRLWHWFAIVGLLSLVITACGGGGGGSGTPAPTAPGAPANLAAAAGNSQVALTWSASTGAASYNIYYGTATGVTKASPTKVTGLTGTSYTMPSLTNGTPYFFVVTAVNANGESPLSLEVSATPAALPPPPAPSNLTAAADNGRVGLTWTASTGATSYNVYAATTSPVIPGAGTLAASGITATSTNIGSLANNTAYYFVVTALNANGESGTSNEVSATPSLQYDLAGTWNFIHFYAGPGVTAGTKPGWVHGTATVDASGSITLSNLAAAGALPTSTAVTWTMNADRTISETGGIAGNPSASHLVLSSSKQIIVGTSSDGSDRLIRIYIRQVQGVTFSNSDLANTSFVFHDLRSGSDNVWAYGSGSFDGSLQQSISSINTPAGPGTLPPAATASISATGIVTSTDAAFHGIMTPDKKTIFSTTTALGLYYLRIFQITGQTYAISDLAGAWSEHAVASSPTAPDWQHSTLTFDNTGSGTFTNYERSTGPQADFSINAALSPTGVISRPGAVDVNGFMSFNRDLFVVTSTWTSGQLYALTVDIK